MPPTPPPPLHGTWRTYTTTDGLASLKVDHIAQDRDGDGLPQGGKTDIYVIAPDGSDTFRLTETPDELEVELTWSPDGSKLAYASDRDGNVEVYVINADGSNPINLTNDGGLDANPNWSRSPVTAPTLVRAQSWGRVKAQLGTASGQASK